MPLKRMVMQLGMGTDIRGEDYTKAGIRAVENAIRQNTLTVADAFGVPREKMQIKLHVGAAQPDQINRNVLAAVFPYGNVEVFVEEGGMDTAKHNGGKTILVNVAVIVYLDLLEDQNTGAPA